MDEELIHNSKENSNGNRSDENRNDVNEESGPLDIHDPSNWDKVDQNLSSVNHVSRKIKWIDYIIH